MVGHLNYIMIKKNIFYGRSELNDIMIKKNFIEA